MPELPCEEVIGSESTPLSFSYPWADVSRETRGLTRVSPTVPPRGPSSPPWPSNDTPSTDPATTMGPSSHLGPHADSGPALPRPPLALTPISDLAP